MSKIEGVLFDFGGVVIESPFLAFAELETRFGLSTDAVRQINSRNPDANAWAQLERATVDGDRFVQLFQAEAAELGHELDARAVLQVLQSLPMGRAAARPEILQAVASCQEAGLRVGLLTNNIIPTDVHPEAAWVHDAFDVVVESCRIGLRKPDPEIYPYACAALGSPIRATVLLDDLGINLKAARAAGMHTIKVIDPEVAIDELMALIEGPTQSSSMS
jgi:putative hydrolase of the HAD superfamily